MKRKPSWGLVVANCQQEKTIFTCLKLAAEQTYRPTEVIVVDAGRHWRRRYERVAAEIFEQYPDIRWLYLAANGRSPAQQRHAAIRKAMADVLFLFDDDLLMYPNCAKEIMRVYEADSAGLISGVQACLAKLPPLPSSSKRAAKSLPVGFYPIFPFPAVQSLIGQQLLRIKTNLLRLFSPAYDNSELPPTVQQLNVALVKSSQRNCMTYRRQVLLDQQFELLLLQYVMYEDSSLSDRPARYKPVVKALDAKVYRYRSGSHKLAGYQMFLLGASNQLTSVSFY